MVVESGKVVWGSYSDGTFTPATDKKNATPYVELTLANGTANKIYIAVADLVNEHKAGTGISITNNTDGTRTIALTSTYDTMVNAAVKAFELDAKSPHKFIAKTNSGTVSVFELDPTLSWQDTDTRTLGLSDTLSKEINDADLLSKANKTGLDALTERVDGIVATGGEANQDAYSNIKVGSTTLAASAKTDTITFTGGTDIKIAASTAGGNKSVLFSHATPTGAAANTVGFYKFATDLTGHATSLTAVTASDITELIGAHSLTLSKTNAENDTAAITIGSTSYTVGPIPLGNETNPAEGTVRYILNH